MTSLTPKEREDLQTVFSAITDTGPKHKGKLIWMKDIIFSHTFYRFSRWMKKGVSYQK